MITIGAYEVRINTPNGNQKAFLCPATTIWGLIRYSVFPFEDRKIVEIEHLEANPISTYQKHPRLVEPIGKWLIWYVAKLALTRCSCADTDTLIILASVTDAVDYYRDAIKMDYLGNAPSAPGEDAYAFRFTREKATEFCDTQERECGIASSFEC